MDRATALEMGRAVVIREPLNANAPVNIPITATSHQAATRCGECAIVDRSAFRAACDTGEPGIRALPLAMRALGLETNAAARRFTVGSF
jgi:hypothetical protein